MKMAPEIKLSTEDRNKLNEIVSKGVSPARVQTRARILLMAGDSKRRRTNSNKEIAEILGINARTVSRIRQRYIEEGLDSALYDRMRPGRPVEIDGEAEAKMVALVCSDPPEGRDHWTLKLVADQMVKLEYVEHISPVWVMKRLKKTNSSLGKPESGSSPR